MLFIILTDKDFMRTLQISHFKCENSRLGFLGFFPLEIPSYMYFVCMYVSPKCILWVEIVIKK